MLTQPATSQHGFHADAPAHVEQVEQAKADGAGLRILSVPRSIRHTPAGMDLHHLRHFVAVADTLHFGRAAARLGMSQPPLSQSIQRLETTLGVQLFHRSRSGVLMSPAGLALLPHAKSMLQQANIAEQVVRQAASGEFSLLRVGFIPWSLPRALPRAIRQFRQQWQGVQVHLFERASRQQLASLKAASLDLAVISLTATDTEGFETQVVETSRRVVAVPTAWELASKPGLRISDLAEQPFVIFPPSLSPTSHETFEAACREAGFRPRITQETAQPYTMLNMVANELGIALIQSTAATMKPEGVTLIPLMDAPASFETVIAMAWTPQALTPALRSFIATLSEAASEDQQNHSIPPLR